MGVATLLRALGIAVVAAAAFVLVLKVSVAGAYRDSDPARALKWYPSDADAKARAAAQIVAADPAEGRERAIALAQDALARDPTRVIAVRALGYAADAGEASQWANLLMEKAHWLSRRDQPTQLWLVKEHYRRGDHAGMVRHFDIASRTSDRSWVQLFPIMIAATADPRVHAQIARTLSEKPNWWRDFVAELVSKGPELPLVVSLVRDRLDPDVPEERAIIVTLLQRLTNAREFGLAWSVYSEAVGMPAASRESLVRDGGFEAASALAPFEWSLGHDPDLAAARQVRGDLESGVVLSLLASNGRSGEVARQLVRLPGGAYRLEADVGQVPQTMFERPLLKIVCADGISANTLIALRPNAPSEAVQRIRGNFTVPGGCQWHWLTVQVGGDGPVRDSPPWIDNVVIRRTSS
ncbi:hypothetical protein [Sphingosinicella sp. LY1275]|uniref:hypothetical protein n=1 Tax=Sphingosinicella sp. LY1275 TaxID=3095379 RepID=UPI002ADECBD1|nr:hypothetical protein [Sphingosinicella sp. LY1275]MEA1014472.1 hypothetical protein [Sphingosinicella sp. LY1275]